MASKPNPSLLFLLLGQICFQVVSGNGPAMAAAVPPLAPPPPPLAGIEPVIGIPEAKHMYENGVFNW